ncbi:MAG: hypothetical protein KJO07_19705 [Deltaproteobacteria bacterium]|nr:hypothetical protein [Deltaproteobacteria bacterium]
MNLLLTGRPGIGKTTVIKALVGELEARGFQPGGFVAVEERVAGRRVGFRIESLDGRESKIMAHVDLISAVRVGRYGVDVEIIDYVVDTQLPRDRPLTVLDEIGPMECASSRFVKRVRELLDGPSTVVATVAARGAGFIAECRDRDDVELVYVVEDNRDQLARTIVAGLA